MALDTTLRLLSKASGLTVVDIATAIPRAGVSTVNAWLRGEKLPGKDRSTHSRAPSACRPARCCRNWPARWIRLGPRANTTCWPPIADSTPSSRARCWKWRAA